VCRTMVMISSDLNFCTILLSLICIHHKRYVDVEILDRRQMTC
jgi:hypothetical protein